MTVIHENVLEFEQPGLTLLDLASILESIKNDHSFSKYSLIFSQKTDGGIGLVDNNSNRKVNLLKGSRKEEWPYISDETPANMIRHKNDVDIFNSSNFCISDLLICVDQNDIFYETAKQLLFLIKQNSTAKIKT